MTEHDISGKTVLVVEVPEKSSGYQTALGSLVFYKDTPSFANMSDISLPPGSWQLLGLSDSFTEEQAKEIVESWKDSDEEGESPYQKHYEWTCYKAYDIHDEDDYFDTALESFHSWLTSQGYDLNKKYVILIKKNQNP